MVDEKRRGIDTPQPLPVDITSERRSEEDLSHPRRDNYRRFVEDIKTELREEIKEFLLSVYDQQKAEELIKSEKGEQGIRELLNKKKREEIDRHKDKLFGKEDNIFDFSFYKDWWESEKRHLDKRLSKKDKDALMAVCFIDIDFFKNLNSELGHGNADLILREFAARFRNALGRFDIKVRRSGDEFIFVINGIHKDKIKDRLQNILDKLTKEPFNVRGKNVEVAVSMGVKIVEPNEEIDSNAALEQADEASELAKIRDNKQESAFFIAGSYDKVEKTESYCISVAQRSLKKVLDEMCESGKCEAEISSAREQIKTIGKAYYDCLRKQTT